MPLAKEPPDDRGLPTPWRRLLTTEGLDEEAVRKYIREQEEEEERQERLKFS